ncbi:MAG: IS3 family transposase [Thermodesulfobacteriota bacterium]|nr:IS3 family transposase [Thermodesulfobacteriota bacterium]
MPLNSVRQSFYRWFKAPQGIRKKEDKRLLLEIRKIFMENRQVYGPKRIAEHLRKDGKPCGKTRAKRLMEKSCLKPKRRTKFKKTTNSKHSRKVSPNLVNQDFRADMADQLWASDIAYIQTLKGTLCLAVILDVFSRKIVGWSMQQRIKDSLVIDAFNSEWNSRRSDKGLLFHSDRGSQYCSGSFIKVLRTRECLQSMSSTGNCYDNAITETFF